MKKMRNEKLEMRKKIRDEFYSLVEPAQDGDGDGVAEGLVAWAVLGRFAAMGNEREIVGEAHQPLAFAGGQAADGGTTIGNKGNAGLNVAVSAS